MPSPTVCTVSGVTRGLNGSVLAGVIVQAFNLNPWIHTTDNSLIIPYSLSTTSAADGTWALNLAETTTNSNYVTIAFVYPTTSTSGTFRKEYTVIIPNAASSTFAALLI